MSQIRIDVAEWLIAHKDGLQADIHSRHTQYYHLFPAFLADIYEYYYANGVMEILRNKIMDSFNLNYEEIELFFNKRYVIMCLGDKIFDPPKG